MAYDPVVPGAGGRRAATAGAELGGWDGIVQPVGAVRSILR